MNINFLIQYAAMDIAVIMLIIKRKGMKRYIPLGLFSTFYANLWCYAAEYFKLWCYPARLVPYTTVSVPFNYVVLPVIAMFWMRYLPVNTAYRYLWAFLWSAVIIGFEFVLTRYTNILKYHNGYDIHISFVLWLITFYIFLKFYDYITTSKYLDD